MRILVLILALGGALGSGFLGYLWFSELQNPRTINVSQASPEGKKLLTNATYLIMGALPLGVFGGFLALRRRGVCAAPLLIVSWAGPVVVLREFMLQDNYKLLIYYSTFTGALLVAGLLAFLVRPQKAVPKPVPALAEGDLEES